MEDFFSNIVESQLKEELIALRREFHKFPELGWQEFYTTGKIMEYLERIGIPFLYGKDIINRGFCWGRNETAIKEAEQVAVQRGMDAERIKKMEHVTGLAAIIEGKKEGPVVVLRFDMDGLPEEESSREERIPNKENFCSEHMGCMHACGHDGHMAIGLVLSKILWENREKLCGTVRIVFQPAEEGVRAGKAFATGGALKGADYFLSGHLGMGNQTGELVLGTYGFLATTKLDAEFIGVSAHAGASPERGKNALLAACSAVLALETLCQDSRGVSRINVGTMEAGSGRNVIADHALIRLETRGETTEIEEELHAKAVACVKGAAAMYGCRCQLKTQGGAPEAKSDKALIQRAKTALMEEQLIGKEQGLIHTLYEEKPFQGSEDASYFMKEIQKHGGQALYLGIGSNITAPHHNIAFDFDENSLFTGVKVYFTIVKELMKGEE